TDNGQLTKVYQGISIMETICTASRSTFFFRAVAIDSPSSGTNPAMDCTRTGGAGSGGAPGARSGGGGGGAPGPRSGRDRIWPVRRSFQTASTALVVSLSRTYLRWLRVGVFVETLWTVSVYSD